MVGNIEATQALYRALLHATPDLVLLLDQDRICGVSPGGAGWLDPAALKNFTLPELLSESQYTEFSQSRDAATQAPGQRVDMEVLVSPEQLKSWATAGMQKATYFEMRIIALDKKQLLCVLRDITRLHVLEKQSSSDVMRDPLTGLRSHRSLMTVLEKAFGDSKRFEENIFSLIIIDIDNFSDINDRYGWDAGDEVLRAVGGVLDQQRRSSDYLCRYGNDLFAMLLAETRSDQAIGAGQRIQRLCAELSFGFAEEPLNLTISAGVATYNESIATPQGLVQMTQDNLLVAIAAAGNKVIGPI